MAHFLAQAQGSRGATHRLGGKSGGAEVVVQGWNDGIRVVARYDEQKQQNYYEVTVTGGSSGGRQSVYLGTVSADGTFIGRGGVIIQ